MFNFVRLIVGSGIIGPHSSEHPPLGAQEEQSATTEAIIIVFGSDKLMRSVLTKEVNRPNRRPSKGKGREIDVHVEGNKIVAVGSELNARLGSGARLRKAVADGCSGDAAFQGKEPKNVRTQMSLLRTKPAIKMKNLVWTQAGFFVKPR